MPTRPVEQRLELQHSSEPLKSRNPLKTLFLNPPSFERFDGGASSRWPATREIESYWYAWSTLRPITSRGGRSPQSSRTTSSLRSSQVLWAGTATRGCPSSSKNITPPSKSPSLGRLSPHHRIGHSENVPPSTSSDAASLTSPLSSMQTEDPLNVGISYKDSNGVIQHNPECAQLSPEQLDEMPWATEIYHRDLDVTKYSVPFLLHPSSRFTPRADVLRNAPSASGR
jgi:hypothetical protein